MHEKNIALLCDEADRLLQLNINLLRQMVEEPDVLSDSKNENRLLFDKQKALKRIEELEGEQIKTARREMVLAVVGTMKAGKSTTINAIVGQEILPNRNRPMTSVPTLIRHVPGKTEPVLHLEHIQPVRNLLITLQEKLATPAGQQVAQTLQQTGDNRALHELRKNGTLPVDEAWVDDFIRGAFGCMKKEYVCKDSELATEGATDLWEGSLIDQLITEVIQSSHSRAAALAVDSAAAKLMQNAENISEYLLLRHQGLQQSIQSLQSHITSLLADIREIADCQEQMRRPCAG